jgi:hypothetical protein
LTRIGFAVTDAGARGHELHVSVANDAAGSERVFMAQLPVQHVGEDFHVLVRMGAEAHARRDEIFIDHAQSAEAHVLRIIVIRKGKRKVGVQPAVIGVTAILV